jgi:hypothetical protein
MQIRIIVISLFFGWLLMPVKTVCAQQKGDTTFVVSAKTDANSKDSGISTKSLLGQDTAISPKFDPKKAALRSAIIPGWGQAYNKKYWKIPIVYGALGTTAGVFFFNINTYKKLRQAYIYITDTIPGNNNLIDPRFQGLSPQSIKSYRNAVRQDVDYSVLVFLLFWGLNVVDATVDAHLKAFDVSPDIGMRIKPGFNYMSNNAGVSLVFFFKDKKSKPQLP